MLYIWENTGVIHCDKVGLCFCLYSDPPVRLSGDSRKYLGRAEGRMENGTWGTVCDTGWDINYWPSVYCREIGYLRFVAFSLS